MPGNFDDIIRRVLGMQPSVLDEAAPFGGSQLGPMIEKWLSPAPPVTPQNSMVEGQKSPMTPWDEFRFHNKELAEIAPYIPGLDPTDDVGPTIIPNNRPGLYDPDRPSRYDQKHRTTKLPGTQI